MKRYKAVVIGCGKIGALWGMDAGRPQPAAHAAAFAANSRTELVGIVDTDADQLKKAGAFYKVSTHNDAQKCFEVERPDIVVIATPPQTHEGLLALALEHKIPAIICEKPISDSLDSAKRMVAMVQGSSSIVIVNHQRRFFPLFQEVRTRIQKGEFGRIQQASAYYSNGLLNNGTHTIDALRFLLNDTPQWAIGVENKLNIVAPFGTNIDGMLGFTKGTVVAIQSVDNDSWGAHDFVLFGEKGAIVIRRYGFSLEVIRAKEGVTFPGMRELDWSHPESKTDIRGMLADAVEHVVACLDGKVPPCSTLEDGRRAMEVIDALTESAARGGKMVELTV